MKKLHWEILDEQRKVVFEKLLAFRRIGYLSGGTSLALQIGHRVSYDFDIFCDKEISDALPSKVKKVLPIKEVLVNNSDEFTFFTEGEIKISFIYYPFDLRKYSVDMEGSPLKILSPLGVALAKAYALNRRSAWRDYVDVYFILKKEIVTIGQIIEKAEEVFDGLFNEKLFLSQLLYTEDISEDEISQTELLEQISLEEVKNFFQDQIDKYLESKKL